MSPSDVYCSCISWFSALCPGFCSCYWRFSPFCIRLFANARQQKSVFWGTFPLFFLFFIKRKLFFDCIQVVSHLNLFSFSFEFPFRSTDPFCKISWNSSWPVFFHFENDHTELFDVYGFTWGHFIVIHTLPNRILSCCFPDCSCDPVCWFSFCLHPHNSILRFHLPFPYLFRLSFYMIISFCRSILPFCSAHLNTFYLLVYASLLSCLP